MAKRTIDKLTATAYHEAGHAVIAHELRIRFKLVTVKPEADSLGHVLRSHPSNFRPDLSETLKTRDRVERNLVVMLSGLAAERKLTGRHNWGGAGEDLRQSVDLASYLFSNAELCGKYLEFIKSFADDIVARRLNWLRIKALAAALLEQETLTESQAIAAMRDAINREFEKLRRKQQEPLHGSKTKDE